MTFQTAAPLTRLNLEVSNGSSNQIAMYVNDGYLVMDPPYQRGHVWTDSQRISLIFSLICGLPIPAIIFNDRTNLAWINANGGINPSHDGGSFMAVVDGKQRITTLHMWYSDQFSVPASWFPSEDVTTTEDTPDGAYVRFSGLSVPRQRDMKFMCTIPTATAKVATVEAEADLYLLLNGGGTPHTDADMMRAVAYSSDAQA